MVNFSDSRSSVNPGAVTLAGQYSGNPLAGYAAKHASEPIWIFDLLWHDLKQATKAPRKELLNVLNDLNWVVCRSGWDANDSVVAFKSGGPANHEHADRNHIMFKAHEERLLNDHVGAAYDRRHEGWKMRATRATTPCCLMGKDILTSMALKVPTTVRPTQTSFNGKTTAITYGGPVMPPALISSTITMHTRCYEQLSMPSQTFL